MAEPYRLRSRKSWALLAYLLLTERPTSRGRLAELLFAEADDPLRALRWSLAEIRRALGDDGSIEGDPVVLTLADDVLVDVVAAVPRLLGRGRGGGRPRWRAARGTGRCAEPRRSSRGCSRSGGGSRPRPRRCCTRPRSGLLARGELDRARGFAVRAAAMSPLDENHQALVIRLYRLAGDDEAAERQYAGLRPPARRRARGGPGRRGRGGPARATARRRRGRHRPARSRRSSRPGSAAIAAGAIDPGIAVAARRGAPRRRGPA